MGRAVCAVGHICMVPVPGGHISVDLKQVSQEQICGDSQQVWLSARVETPRPLTLPEEPRPRERGRRPCPCEAPRSSRRVRAEANRSESSFSTKCLKSSGASRKSPSAGGHGPVQAPQDPGWEAPTASLHCPVIHKHNRK